MIDAARQKGTAMKNQTNRYHVITWSHDSGEDSKGSFSAKASAMQDMRRRVNADGYDGAVVFDRASRRPIAVCGDYPRFYTI